MNKYKKILFKHLDGIVLFPTIINLHKIGLYDLMGKYKYFSMNDIIKIKKLYSGYLNVSLRTLRCNNLLNFKQKNTEYDHEYSVNKNFIFMNKKLGISNKIYKLIYYHINFNKLSTQNENNYSNLLLELQPLLDSNNKNNFKIYSENFEGLVIGPIIANLFFHNHAEYYSNKFKIIDLNQNLSNSIYSILSSLNFITKNNKYYQTTNKGKYILDRSSAYGVTVSYLDTLYNISTLLTNDPKYIWRRTKNNHEIHINRSMNVWGSGGAHKTYFQKADNILIDIFNQDIKKQPKGIIDIGCGDGTFLKHAYNIIINKTIRKDFLDKYPLLLIGTDINKKARIASKNTLKNISNIIINGNISNPNDINRSLYKKYNLKLKDLLNCRTFLDHNRTYSDPKKHINHKIYSYGSFSYKGKLITSKNLINNFLEHLTSWKPFVMEHGLILIELHTIDPKTTKNNLGKTLSCAYDATHGYSDQYLIEYDVFKKCLKKIGLNITEKNQYLFPNKHYPTVSINYIK